MEAADLDGARVRFFAVFDGDDALAIGALKAIDAAHGEVKSMHVRQDRRGLGLADTMLSVLLETARSLGMTRVSLETGSQDAFAPARAFYRRNGFAACAPFEGYGPDPNSFFMTKPL